jgi:predicted amidohydrolase
LVNVAVIQMDCTLGNIEENLTVADKLLQETVKAGARFVILPELFSSGYVVDENSKDFAESLQGPTVSRLLSWAKEHDIWLAATFIESRAEDGQMYDTGILVGPKGIVGIARKKALWGEEGNIFQNDTSPCEVFETPFGKVGIVICYEVGIPEISRQLALKGADIIVIPSAFGMSRLYAWKLATRSRALENGCFVIASNRVGRDNNIAFCGHSRIISPQGEVLHEITVEQGWVNIVIDQDEVHQQRENIPYLKEWERLRRTIDFN